MNVPITQTKAWQDLQTDLGVTSFLETGKRFQFLALLNSTPVGNYLYLPYGPVYDTPQGFQQALEALQQLAQAHQAIFIRIEPRDPNFAAYAPANAVKTKDLNPKETWLLDLTGNDDALKAKLPARLLRYHRAAAKKGITIETSHDPADIHYLLELQRTLADQKGISTFSENYLKTELKQPFATLYLVKQSLPKPASSVAPKSTSSTATAAAKSTSSASFTTSKSSSSTPVAAAESSLSASDPSATTLLAAGLVFDDPTTRYNLQGAQTEQGRKLHATGILTIQLILDAQSKGLKTFDFWGIAPEDAPPDHPWAGFTAFKKTFAGSEQDFAGTYDLVLSRPRYALYKAFRSLNRSLRKIH